LLIPRWSFFKGSFKIFKKIEKGTPKWWLLLTSDCNFRFIPSTLTLSDIKDRGKNLLWFLNSIIFDNMTRLHNLQLTNKLRKNYSEVENTSLMIESFRMFN